MFPFFFVSEAVAHAASRGASPTPGGPGDVAIEIDDMPPGPEMGEHQVGSVEANPQATRLVVCRALIAAAITDFIALRSISY